MTPIRIQRSRAKGWRMPEGTIYVGRPGPWGNPFPVTGDWIPWAAFASGFRADRSGRLAASLAFYRHWIRGDVIEGPHASTKSDDLIVYSDGKQIDTMSQAREMAVGFAAMMRGDLVIPPPPTIEEVRSALRGKSLACWCPVDQPCHAAVLLEIANG